MKKKIFIPMQEAGAGHKMPALAIKDGIDTLYPDKYDVEVVDWLKVLDEATDKKMKDTWNFALANPFWARFGYKVLQWTFPLSRYFFDVAYSILNKRAVEFYKENYVDIVFSTHFWSARATLNARDKLGLKFKVITYVTDPFDGHYLWAEKRVDTILVASEIAKEQLIGYGVDGNKVKILPFPINKKFVTIGRDKETIQKEYNINTNYKTILATAGGQGIGEISKYVMKMFEDNYEYNIIYVCGRNEELKKTLENLVESKQSKTNIIPLGFVSNMNELLLISDFTIAKAGASTTFEALLLNNPIIFTDWATYPEKPNVDFCVDNNVGWLKQTEAEFFALIKEIQDTDILDRYKKNLESLHLHTGVDEISQFIVDELEK